MEMKSAGSKRAKTPKSVHTIEGQSKTKNNVRTEDYHRLLGYFGSDPQQAAKEYEAFRKRLIVFFDRRGCRNPELEADDAFTRAARSKDLNDINDIVDFIYGIAKTQAMETHRKQSREPGQLNDNEHLLRTQVMPVPQATEESKAHEIRLQCLDTCLTRLPKKDRKLLLDYYREEKAAKLRIRKLLAQKLGIRMEALRTRLTRARDKIGACYEECMKDSLRQVK
jgi:DNA-directed RNA polymerase specialized sigma24 family protein